jgi:hypothetical protein
MNQVATDIDAQAILAIMVQDLMCKSYYSEQDAATQDNPPAGGSFLPLI